jgi:hypothetical protein
MINVYKIRKWGGLLFCGLFTVISFFIGLTFYGLLIGLGTMFAGLLCGVLLANLMLKNPFIDMLEGKGIMVMNWDSTGVIRPSLVGLDPPYIRGKMGKSAISDVWNRATVAQIEAPNKNVIKAKKITEGENAGGLKIEIDEKKYNEARFALFHWPVLIWNDQIKSLVTKDWIAAAEKETFAEHGILYMNRKMEELTSAIRDFGRYVVENTKPKGNILQSKWFWIVVVVLIVLLIAMFIPPIVQNISGFFETSGGAFAGAAPSAPVTPR